MYTIIGYDPDASDPVPTSIEQYYSRTDRVWVTILRDEDGYDIESSCDGTRKDAAVAKARYQSVIDSEGM